MPKLAALALVAVLALAGCASTPTPAPTVAPTATEAVPTNSVNPGGDSTCTTEQLDFFISAFDIASADILSDFAGEGFPAIMGTPSCVFAIGSSYIAVYLNATQEQFDGIEAAWVAAGFTAEPPADAQGAIAAVQFVQNGSPVATLQLGSGAGTTIIGGDFMVGAGTLDAS